MNIGTKGVIAFCWGIIALTTVMYMLSGAAFPRPLYLFGSIAFCLSLLVAWVIFADADSLTPISISWVAGAGLMSGVLLRISGYIHVASSGIDHGRWLGRVNAIITAQSIVGDDMYAASPFYMLELVIGKLVLGIGLFETRYLTIIIASLLPLFIGLFAWRSLGNLRTGLIALLLTVSSTFYLRTATLLESESLAILWFVITVYLLLRSIQENDRRYFALLLVFSTLIVVLHFLYAVIVFATLAGMIMILYLTRYVRFVDSPISRGQSRQLGVLICLVALFIPFWILWSVAAHTGVVVLASGLSVTLPSNPLGLFIPSGPTTVSASVGGGGSASLADTFGKFLPLGILFTLAAVGGIYLLYRRRRTDVFLIAGGITTVGMTVVALAASLEFNLGFRFYYFVTVMALVFAAVALTRLTELLNLFSKIETALVLLVVLVIVIYASLAPLSPLGNNVDPRFGGQSWTVTETEQQQLVALNRPNTTSSSLTILVNQLHPFLAPQGWGGLYLTEEECISASTVATTGDFHVCTANVTTGSSQ